jgi:hypothetical protein
VVSKSLLLAILRIANVARLRKSIERAGYGNPVDGTACRQ